MAGRYGVALALLAAITGSWGCAIRRTIRISPPQLPGPPKQASVAELVKDVNAWSENIHTLSATVDFTPTVGTVYSGVIKEYQEVRGFILLEQPSLIRMIGQAPIVRTDIFDMVSNGQEFRLWIPSKNKFIVGNAGFHKPTKNALENLRPQHILNALLIPPINSSKEKVFSEQEETPTHRYYVLTIIELTQGGEVNLKRKVWFDRSDLNISRLELYGSQGELLEDVDYMDYRGFQGISYPTQVVVKRPAEGYTLTITLEDAVFNKPIPAAEFELKKPPNAKLIELSAAQ